MSGWQALGCGLAGAATLTAVHETARRHVAEAPRMDVLAERAIARSIAASGRTPPSEDRLHEMALVGDVVSNALFYSLVAVGKPQTAPLRGALLGAAAGAAAVLLPGPMGVGEAPSNRTLATQVMTIGWYTLGGLAAGTAYRLLAGPAATRPRPFDGEDTMIG